MTRPEGDDAVAARLAELVTAAASSIERAASRLATSKEGVSEIAARLHEELARLPREVRAAIAQEVRDGISNGPEPAEGKAFHAHFRRAALREAVAKARGRLVREGSKE